MNIVKSKKNIVLVVCVLMMFVILAFMTVRETNANVSNDDGFYYSVYNLLSLYNMVNLGEEGINAELSRISEEFGKINHYI